MSWGKFIATAGLFGAYFSQRAGFPLNDQFFSPSPSQLVCLPCACYNLFNEYYKKIFIGRLREKESYAS